MGAVTDFPLPNPDSGPTTIALAQDGTVWFTESAGNRIGRMAPDGTDLKEFPLPNPDSSPRIIALGADGNMWFSEHTGNRMGRITPDGTITEFAIPTPNSMPRAIALGSRRQHLVRRVCGREDRPYHAGGRDHRVHDPDARQRPARTCGRT